MKVKTRVVNKDEWSKNKKNQSGEIKQNSKGSETKNHGEAGRSEMVVKQNICVW